MDIQMNSSQRKRIEKIERLRTYFDKDCPEIYEWSMEDESLDFKAMSDKEVTEYLKNA